MRSEREKLISNPKYSKRIDWPSGIDLTKTENEIVTLLGKGLKRKEVCQIIKISRLSLRQHIFKIKQKYKK